MANYTNVSDRGNTSEAIASPSKILNNLVVIPIGVPICLENILAIIVLIRSTRLIYQVRILSINLAITDCLAGLVLSLPDYTFGDCNLKKYFTAPFFNVSLITVTLFNIDRCCSQKFALRYYQIVTSNVLKIACLLSWFVGMLATYMMFFDPSHPLGIYCGLMSLSTYNFVAYSAKTFQLLIILSNMFMYIYFSLSLYIRAKSVSVPVIKTISRSSENIESQNVQPARKPSRKPNTGNGHSFRNQAMVAKKLAVITGFFLFCCTPYFLLQVIPNVDYSRGPKRFLFAFTGGLMFINSAINPCLYVWRFTEARYQLRRMLYCWSAGKLRKLEVERKSFFATYQINISTSENRFFPS
jgi:hypothetical protein